jgi:hypothetical protein
VVVVLKNPNSNRSRGHPNACPNAHPNNGGFQPKITRTLTRSPVPARAFVRVCSLEHPNTERTRTRQAPVRHGRRLLPRPPPRPHRGILCWSGLSVAKPTSPCGMVTLMSRGPGRIEHAIEAVFTAAPDDAYTTEDLIDRAYPGLDRVEKKHRVAVLRAAKKVCNRIGLVVVPDSSAGRRTGFLEPVQCTVLHHRADQV